MSNFSIFGSHFSIVHFNFSKDLFQFFKCVNTFSLQGPVIGPTKVLVEWRHHHDVSIPIPVFPIKTSCEWFNVCMIMKKEIAPLKQLLFYWVYLKALLQTHLIQCSNWEVSINAHEWRNQIFFALHVICLSIICLAVLMNRISGKFLSLSVLTSFCLPLISSDDFSYCSLFIIWLIL